MLEIVQYKTEKADKLIQNLEKRQQQVTPRIDQQVRNIIRAVQRDGDKAVLQYTKEFDDVIHSSKSLLLTESIIRETAAKVKPEYKKVLKKAIDNITAYHQKQKILGWSMKNADGVVMGQKVYPLNRVGLYVPGGSGAYPSSILMNVIPARIAGVKEIVIVTPPFKKGVSPEIAYTMQEMEVKEVYLIGGAQAVAALAYGTESIRRVDKIVGPGNLFVSVAKRLVFGDIDIDMIAGPSEVVIVADETAEASWIASDMLSQAEHGSGYEMAVCITTAPQVAISLHRELIQQTAKSPRKALLEKSLSQFGGLFVVKNINEAIELVDILAPEHLEILIKQPSKVANAVRNVGAMFLGPWTPEAVGDYYAGPNHILPTGGTARFFSPLGVYDFIKRTSFIEYTKGAIKKSAKDIMLLAETEGFYHHKDSVARRLAQK
jgi:histidinol dehydrogenase